MRLQFTSVPPLHVKVRIYALCEPGTQNVRYIGKTAQSLHNRVWQHLWQARSQTHLTTHKINWLRSLLAKGQEPSVLILDIVTTDDWELLETFYIRAHRRAGFRLTNATDGGEGIKIGTKLSPEHRKKISIAGIGRKQSEEHIIKRIISCIGKPRSKEVREKISTTLKNRIKNEDNAQVLANISNNKKETRSGFTRWSIEWDACRSCGRTDRRHDGHGYCSACALQQRRAMLPKITRSKRWAKEWDSCHTCGTAERKHAGHGLCQSCRDRARHKESVRLTPEERSEVERKKLKKRRSNGEHVGGQRLGHRWSRKWDACINCHKKDKRHASGGLCYTCYNYQYKRKSPKREKRTSGVVVATLSD